MTELVNSARSLCIIQKPKDRTGQTVISKAREKLLTEEGKNTRKDNQQRMSKVQ